jgi:hypothetical protein
MPLNVLTPKLQNTPLPHPVSSTDCTTPKHNAPFTKTVLRLPSSTSLPVTYINTLAFSHLPPPSLELPFLSLHTKHKSSLPSAHAQHSISTAPTCPFHSLLSGTRRKSRSPGPHHKCYCLIHHPPLILNTLCRTRNTHPIQGPQACPILCQFLA